MSPAGKTIFVYAGDGADPFCVDSLLRACRTAFGAETIDTDDLLAGGWQERAAVLALPGGADRPYARKLSGRGNQLIRGFVEGGGTYLGICAGAYYACRRIHFVGRDFQVIEERELGFFPGTAIGSIPELAPPYRVRDPACSAAVELATAAGPVTSLYWGGCRFEPDPGAPSFEALARYAALLPEKNLAAVRCGVGRGWAVLVGVHAEISADDFDRHRREHAGDCSRLDEQVSLLSSAEPARAAFFESLLQAP